MPNYNFIDLVKSLKSEAVMGYVNLEIFITYQKYFKEAKTNTTKDIFLTFTINAHISELHAYLAKLFKDQKSSASLHQFLRYIEHNKKQFKNIAQNILTKEVKKDKEALLKSSSLIDKVITKRDKFYSHIDKTLINKWEEFLQENDITTDEAKQLYEQAFNIIDKYNEYYDGTRFGPETKINLNQLDSIIKSIIND